MQSKQLIDVDPSATLRFCLRKDQPIKETLKLTNKTAGHMAFKVKTTAPKSYLVRPSSGIIGPHASASIDIHLQTQGDGRNSRFLVQAHPAESAEQVSREQWSLFKKEDMEERQLTVVLEESADEPAMGNTSHQPRPSPAADKSPLVGEAPADQKLTYGELAKYSTDLKQQYDELVAYTLMLEKQKKKLESDLAEMKAANGHSSGDAGGYTKVHIMLVALLVLLLSYAANVLGRD